MVDRCLLELALVFQDCESSLSGVALHSIQEETALEIAFPLGPLSCLDHEDKRARRAWLPRARCVGTKTFFSGRHV